MGKLYVYYDKDSIWDLENFPFKGLLGLGFRVLGFKVRGV